MKSWVLTVIRVGSVDYGSGGEGIRTKSLRARAREERGSQRVEIGNIPSDSIHADF